MKKLLFLVMAFFLSLATISAQDLISKRNGDDIKAKVIETDNSSIKYRLAEEPDGVVYSIPKSEVLEIHYASGRNEVFNDSFPGLVGRTIPEGIVPGMKYKQLKKLYDHKDYIPGTVERHRKPGGCGVASFFIPGLGQLIEGEVGRGLGWLGGAVLSNVLLGVGVTETINYSLQYDDFNDEYYIDEFGPEHLAIILGFVGSVTTCVWSTIDAVRIAKVQNLYYSDLKQQRGYSMEIYPSTDYIRVAERVQPTAGVTFALKF